MFRFSKILEKGYVSDFEIETRPLFPPAGKIRYAKKGPKLMQGHRRKCLAAVCSRFPNSITAPEQETAPGHNEAHPLRERR
jgi:hypothetical protein